MLRVNVTVTVMVTNVINVINVFQKVVNSYALPYSLGCCNDEWERLSDQSYHVERSNPIFDPILRIFHRFGYISINIFRRLYSVIEHFLILPLNFVKRLVES